jgi:transcription elongation factor Elf1
MADKAKDLKQGDPCPNCGGELAAVAGAPDKDGQTLYRCRSCGYNTRFKAAATAEAPASTKK